MLLSAGMLLQQLKSNHSLWTTSLKRVLGEPLQSWWSNVFRYTLNGTMNYRTPSISSKFIFLYSGLDFQVMGWCRWHTISCFLWWDSLLQLHSHLWERGLGWGFLERGAVGGSSYVALGMTSVSHRPHPPFSMHSQHLLPSLGQGGEEHIHSKTLSIDTLLLDIYPWFLSSKPVGGLSLALVR